MARARLTPDRLCLSRNADANGDISLEVLDEVTGRRAVDLKTSISCCIRAWFDGRNVIRKGHANADASAEQKCVWACEWRMANDSSKACFDEWRRRRRRWWSKLTTI